MPITKKILSVLLAMLFVFGTMSAGAGSALAAGTVPFSGSGTQDSPYLIASDADWQAFAQYVADGGETSGKYFRQTADVTASVPVGSSEFQFKGTYDGSGKTLTATLDIRESCLAPFSHISGATIENMHVTGMVNGDIHCSGLVGAINGTGNRIRNCLIEATISSTGSHCGGIVGHGGSSTATLEGCVFAGVILGGKHVGVLWGWSDDDARVTIRDCLENGSLYTARNLNPVALGFAKSRTIGNIIYVTPQIGDPDRNWPDYGKRVYKIIEGLNVSLDFGETKRNYSVSGLGYYSTDLVTCGGVGFSQAGKAVALTPSYNGEAPAYTMGFSASAGTFTNGTLTMPEQDVTIDAVPVNGIDTGKAIQLAVNGFAPNIHGAQASSLRFGNYKQSGSKTDGYSVDPIKWRVLSNEDGRLLLLADQNLDVFEYHKQENVYVTWEKSDIRKWLNGTGAYASDSFRANAFTAAEFDSVASTELDLSPNPDYGSLEGNKTTDKVFLLSIAEVMDTAYGFTDNIGSTNKRVSTNTAFTAGGGTIGSTGVYGSDMQDVWWLRSSSERLRAAVVSSVGVIDTLGNWVYSTGVTVRPAVNIDLGKVLFTSAAEGGKQIGALEKVPDYTGKDWKLTLRDDSRDGFIACCIRDEDGLRTVKYNGAKTGENEFISAAIVNSEGVVTYYGALCAAKAGKQTVMVDVNGKLQSGDTLYVFNEQLNGDKKTDYAGALIDVTKIIDPLETPTTTFTATGYDTGTLSGLKSGMIYSVNGGPEITAKTASVSLTGLVPCTITVVQPGDGVTNYDSEPQIINVGRAATPSLKPTQPATIRDKGSIPTTTAHQKSTDGASWTNCTGAWTDLAQGAYYVRRKASGTSLASDPQTITIAVARYTVRFVDEDGTLLQSTEYACGETPVYTGKTPTKAPTGEYTYAFAGWSPEITEVTGDTTYTATYQRTPIVITKLAVKKQPTKTVYTYRNDETLDITGLELEATYSNGSVKPVDPAACRISGYSAKPRGEKTITVEYEGMTAQFTVTVKYEWWQWLIIIFLLGFIWY